MLLSELLKDYPDSRYMKTVDSCSENRIFIDLDETIHKYSEGYKDGTVYDDPFEGAREMIKRLRDEGYKVILFTARLSQEGGEHQEELIKQWLAENHIEVDGMTADKLPALAYIDDRAIDFKGKWDEAFYKKIKEKITTKDELTQIEFQGMKITIENPKGSVRKGEDDDGNKWRTRMFYPYGFINKTEGTDGDEIDCFIGPIKDAKDAFIISNMEDGKYDEDKVMLGFGDELHARDAFLAHYDDSRHLGKVLRMSMEDFKKKISTHKRGTRIQ